MVQKKNEKKTLEKEETQVCEPSYKGLAYLLVIFLLFEFIVLCVVAFKYDVSFKPKNECRSYVTQALRREQMRRMRSPAPMYRHERHEKVRSVPGVRPGVHHGRPVPAPHDVRSKARPGHPAPAPHGVQPKVKKAARPVPPQKAVKKPFTEKDMPAVTRKAPACPPPVPRKAKYNPEEYAPYAQKGNASIQGKLCFPLADGSEKCFANTTVFINPVTTYSDEWYNRGWAGREYLATADKRVIPFNKMVKTDKDGNFAFKDLAPGSYYVGTMVCLPKTKDAKACAYTRWAAKVTMKRMVKPTFKKVYP